MKHDTFKIIIAVIGAIVLFKSIPFIFGIHTYFTWEAYAEKIVLDDNTALSGVIKYDDLTLNRYSINQEGTVYIVPADSVRYMQFTVTPKNINKQI